MLMYTLLISHLKLHASFNISKVHVHVVTILTRLHVYNQNSILDLGS